MGMENTDRNRYSGILTLIPGHVVVLLLTLTQVWLVLGLGPQGPELYSFRKTSLSDFVN
jgi:hypothetical protein